MSTSLDKWPDADNDAGVTESTAAAAGLSFRVLGPLEVRLDGRELRVSAAKQRILLASLLLAAGRVVTTDQLVTNIWGDSPIRSARQTLQVYVTRLRDLLGEDTIVTVGHGYLLSAGRGELDLADFDATVDDATKREDDGDLRGAAGLLARALDLWRGEALADVPSEALHQQVVTSLDERRLSVTERRLALELRTGRAETVVGEARRLVTAQPLREHPWALLIRALHATGRQAEALAAYQEVASLLADELGIDPGAELRELHQAVLTGELAVGDGDAGTAASRSVPPVPVVVPRQLPARPAGFVGRRAELDALERWLGERQDSSLVVLSGPPGVGKSAVAVAVGHLMADRYPDGQLFVDLRGFSAEQAMRPADVLPRFLRSLGLPATQVPVELDEQAATYRSLLAGRQVLVVLDNAASAEQVRPLLPGAPGCGVLVTSRDQLRPLVAIDGARFVPLDVLSAEEARLVLAQEIDAERLVADRSAIDHLVELCGHLPLALRIASANLAIGPYDRPSDYVAELRRGERILDLWSGGDGAVVGAAFGISYSALAPATQRYLRLLSQVPGPDFTVPAVAALVDEDERDVKGRLDALVAASLVQPHASGRYRMHDLTREYAVRRAENDEPVQVREAARQRLVDWYIGQADAALVPRFTSLRLVPRSDRVPAPAAEVGIEWIDEEFANLMAAISHAAAHGPPVVSWTLADALRPYFGATERHVEEVAAAELGRGAAERAGDDVGLASMHFLLCDAAYQRRDDAGSVAHGRQAVELFARAGDRLGEAAAWHNLGGAYDIADRHDEAIACVERAVAMFAVDEPDLATRARAGLGSLRAKIGQLAEATAELETVLEIVSSAGAGYADLSLGQVLRLCGRLPEATRHLERATDIHAGIGHRSRATQARIELARCRCDAGDYAGAREAATAALRTAETFDDRLLALDARVALAEAEVRAGGAAEWVDVVPALVDDLVETSDEERTLAGLAVLGLVRRRVGDLDGALAADERALHLATRHALRLPYDDALTSRTATLVGLGRLDEAIEQGEEALGRHRQTGRRLLEARTLEHLGDAREASGDRAAADGLRAEARKVFEAIGAAEATPPSRAGR
ncbi:MAG: tetratricopeptide repeat protein [Streptosporangiales bacterium]|nr:tetratricopeptide repeat protein [Streptosporangiales bacterium]